MTLAWSEEKTWAYPVQYPSTTYVQGVPYQKHPPLNYWQDATSPQNTDAKK